MGLCFLPVEKLTNRQESGSSNPRLQPTAAAGHAGGLREELLVQLVPTRLPANDP